MATLSIDEMRTVLDAADDAGRSVELRSDKTLNPGVLRSFDARGKSCGMSSATIFKAHPDTCDEIADDDSGARLTNSERVQQRDEEDREVARLAREREEASEAAEVERVKAERLEFARVQAEREEEAEALALAQKIQAEENAALVARSAADDGESAKGGA